MDSWRDLLEYMTPEEARTLLDERGAFTYAETLRAVGLSLRAAFTDPAALDVLAELLPGLVGTPEDVLEGRSLPVA